MEEYDIPELDIKRLREHGLRTIQGPSRITDELKRYIQKIITKYYNVSCLDNSDIQKLRDEKYPKDYANPSNINTEQWQHLLKDPNVFRLSDIKLMKNFICQIIMRRLVRIWLFMMAVRPRPIRHL